MLWRPNRAMDVEVGLAEGASENYGKGPPLDEHGVKYGSTARCALRTVVGVLFKERLCCEKCYVVTKWNMVF